MRVLSCLAFTLALSAALLGCHDPVDDAKKADTIESWSAYLALPEASGSNKIQAEDRLEQLMTQQAQTSKSLEDFDALIKRFPKSRNVKKSQKERTDISLAVAEAANTPEGWQVFMTDNPAADPALIKQAKNRITMAEYGPKLAYTELKIEPVNLAEDPKGPKDGWGFSTDITNNGDKSISYLNIQLKLTDPAGAPTNPVTLPAAAPTYKVPMPDVFYTPIAPGETRHWEYTTAEVPAGFVDKPAATLTPITITFAEVK